MAESNPSSTPTLAGDVLQRTRFPFVSWAKSNGFAYPEWAEPLLQRCESAAEAFFVRAFCEREGAFLLEPKMALAGDTLLEIQVPNRLSRIDAVAHHRQLRIALAIEIDGMGFHHASAEQVEADYLRERRLVHDGYALVRFTAREVFRDPKECWRQVEAILDAWIARQNDQDTARDEFKREYAKAIAAEAR